MVVVTLARLQTVVVVILQVQRFPKCPDPLTALVFCGPPPDSILATGPHKAFAQVTVLKTVRRVESPSTSRDESFSLLLLLHHYSHILPL